MKTQILLRKIHHWGSLLIMLQIGLVIGAGLLLSLKKEIIWIQPSTMKGVMPISIPEQNIQELFDRARVIPQLEITNWTDLARVDVKPEKGIVKFVAANN